MRILVTNDDGVHAPGLAVLAGALASTGDHQVTVVAPLANHSGASAAVGTVYERESIAYKTVDLPEAPGVRAYGLDASPALSVIIGALGAFGPKPDLICSGINLGVNVGRSVLHSGTVGATLTGAQLGISGLAVSLRSGADVDHWETAAQLAVSLLPLLGEAPKRTVLNLNVPSVPPGELLGVRHGHISTAGIIKAAADLASGPDPDAPFVAGHDGEVRLTLGAAVPSLGDVRDEAPLDDGAIVAAGWASLTPILGVREATDTDAQAIADRAVAALSMRLTELVS